MNNSHGFMIPKVIFVIFDILIIFGLRKKIIALRRMKPSKAIYGAYLLPTEIPSNNAEMV